MFKLRYYKQKYSIDHIFWEVLENLSKAFSFFLSLSKFA